MKKTIFNLALATTVMASTLFIGCQTSDEKVDAAKADVKDANLDLKEAQKNATAETQKAARAAEWSTFKVESEVKIRDNEIRIAELKAKINAPGKTLDAVRAKRVDELEEQNRNMRTRIVTYENNQSDWEKFKREFNHDMDALGNALQDLTVDNKK
jgi:hypothetical protein